MRAGEDTSKLYTTTAIVPKLVNAGDGKLKTSDQTETVTVALIGVHMVGIIKDHPEFVWGTFELPGSAPDLPAGTGIPDFLAEPSERAGLPALQGRNGG